MKTIVRMQFGSHLYGTNTPASDFDLKSVFIPDGRDIIMGTVKSTISQKRPKSEGEKNYAGEVEEEAFSLKQYLKLLTEGQTVALDMLFAPKEFITYKSRNDDVWETIKANSNRLVTKKSQAFVGYCRQQAKKYGIKGSRVAAARTVLNVLLNMTSFHSLAKLGDYDDVISPLTNLDHIAFVDIPQKDGSNIRHLEVCGRKLSYKASVKNAIDVTQHLVDEYGSRALLAEKNEGLDWKALSHAVRVAGEAVELFETGHIIFPRPDRDLLKEIKLGQLPYNVVADLIEEGFDHVELAATESNLRDDVDQNWIDNFIETVYSDELRSYLN